MKNFKFFLFALIALAITSCEEDNMVLPEHQFDFEAFQAKIQLSESYLEYREKQAVFYGHIENQEIDLFGIWAEIKSNEVENVCLMDASLIEGYKGADKFLSSYCEMKNKAKNLHSLLRQESALTTEQRVAIYKYSPEEIDFRADCLAGFQNDMAWAEAYGEICDNYGPGGGACVLEELYTDIAVENYDNCCDNGGSGCP